MATHNHSKSGEYNSWQHMIQRCENPNSTSFKYYGSRGINIVKRWRHSFDNFYSDMGPKPSTNHSIDRIDNNGPYSPVNCRWTTQETQMQNTGLHKNNKTGIPAVNMIPSGRYQATISVKGKTLYLGTFTNFFEACCARRSAELKYWKDH